MIYVDQHGYRVELVPHDTVQFCQVGGGPVITLKAGKFHELFKPEVASRVMRAGTVTASFLHDCGWTLDGEPVDVPCYSNGTLWYGWGRPYFRRSVVEQMMEYMGDLQWDGNNIKHCDTGEPAVYESEIIVVAGEEIEVWGIGAGWWCWDQVKFEEKK